MKLAVAGTGYVGLVAGVCFAHAGHTVTCVDVNPEKVEMLSRGISPIYEKDLEPMLQENLAQNRVFFTTDPEVAYADKDAIFIGVGTPEQADGSANLTYLAQVCRQIAEHVTRDCLVVVKSTVPVGTNDLVEQYIHDFLRRDVRVLVASNPEFLSQGNAVADTLHASRIVIGTEQKEAEELLQEIYRPFGLPVVSVSRRSAEMIKYASNDFLALKISYMNDIANLCERVGANIDDVAEGMRYDARIGAKFLNAGIGFGGSCFPKDTKALLYLAGQHGYRLQTVEAAVEINQAQKVRLFEKAQKRFMSFNGMKAAVLGVTFKPGTDDLREAPSLANIALLLDKGADLTVYDPVGIRRFHAFYPDIPAAATPQEALRDASVCFIFTEWPQICALTPEDFLSNMRTPVVFDGRNVFDVERMRRAGVEYTSIGR